jgi:hypothetical protein
MPAMKTTLALIFGGCASLVLLSCGNWPYKPAQFIAPVIPPPQNAFVAKDSMTAFAGTGNIKLAYTKLTSGIQVVYFVDFNDSFPTPRPLKKPADKKDWDAWCPIISPNGSLVAYYLVSNNNIRHSAAYCQTLDTTSEPVPIAEPGSDPHFYRDSSGRLFITYADTTTMLQGDLSLITGHATFKQQIDSVTGQKTGNAVSIAPYPFYGGISADGNYLCTGYSFAYIYNLSSQKLFPVNPGKQTCNPSMTPDPVHTGSMMFLNIGNIQAMNNMPAALQGANLKEHKFIFIADTNNNCEKAFSIVDMVPGMSGAAGCEWQCPKWSNAPDFFCALTSANGSDPWDCYLVSISTQAILKLNKPSLLTFDGTSKPYVYRGGN